MIVSKKKTTTPTITPTTITSGSKENKNSEKVFYLFKCFAMFAARARARHHHHHQQHINTYIIETSTTTALVHTLATMRKAVFICYRPRAWLRACRFLLVVF